MHTHIKHTKMALLTRTKLFHSATPIRFYIYKKRLKITPPPHAHTHIHKYILRDIDQTK